MRNEEQPINPCKIDVHRFSGEYFGLTKREYFAALAMQGLLACPDIAASRKAIAEEAVQQADELLKALEPKSE